MLEHESNLKSLLPAYPRSSRAAVPVRPKLTTNFVSRGILLQQGGRLPEAVSAYSSAIRFRPKLALAHLNLGLTLSKLGRTEEAIKILHAGSKLDDNGLKDPKTNANARSSALWHLGKLLLETGDPGRAVTVLQSGLKDHHRDGSGRQRNLENILNLLGEAHQALGHQDAAEAWYSSALEADPSYVPAQLMMAKMLAKNVRELLHIMSGKRVPLNLKANPLIFHLPRFNVKCFSRYSLQDSSGFRL